MVSLLKPVVDVDDVDGDGDIAESLMRVTEVDLSMQGLTGGLADAWADLDELTLLDLSDNSLEGTVPRSVWAFFDDKIAEDGLNLGDNPTAMLEPSPALNLKAVVTKEAAGTTQVALTWDDIGWYTSSEMGSALDVGARTTHNFKYRRLTGVNADDEETWGKYMPVAVSDTTTKDRSSADDSMGASGSDTYSFQVVTVKTTYVDSDGDVDAEADAPVVKESEASRIDVVGPQTLTADNPYSLPVAVAYTAASSSDEDKLTDDEA